MITICHDKTCFSARWPHKNNYPICLSCIIVITIAKLPWGRNNHDGKICTRLPCGSLMGDFKVPTLTSTFLPMSPEPSTTKIEGRPLFRLLVLRLRSCIVSGQRPPTLTPNKAIVAASSQINFPFLSCCWLTFRYESQCPTDFLPSHYFRGCVSDFPLFRAPCFWSLSNKSNASPRSRCKLVAHTHTYRWIFRLLLRWHFQPSGLVYQG